ncbi:ArnT family glycosyltransferase [Ereboglobus luteus]|uniref:Glycosyltransferase RgtA/B/C/D-like domain-containing protein n=1 Tax=Ereboglobus luteus TaxID=1796921 RepID=A0A2U8E1T5_9BACT|nr:glycosyltransferase family 39 protein [Ereboglobus luteus]AWI08827.1 hypothetical protein CKA38_05780 [Ereboglobus luteus]
MTPSQSTLHGPIATNRSRIAIASGFLLLIGVLLFWGLDNYALWDDEALNALGAKGVLETGDTTILVDHGRNIVLYADGLLSVNLHDRSTPPLPAYITAISFHLFGQTSLTARLPFAIMGLLTVAALLWCAIKNTNSRAFIVTLGIALACNVSLLLYLRQSRYYAATCFFSVLVVLLYIYRDRRRLYVWLLPLASIGLFFSNYMNFMALFIAMLADYVFFEHRHRKIPLRDWLICLVPIIVVCGLACLVWNPYKTELGTSVVSRNTIWDRIMLFFWFCRDINACEFVSYGAIIAIFGVGIWKKDTIILRGILAIVIYMIFVVAVMPQARAMTSVGDVRYIMPIIPLLIWLSARVITILSKNCAPFAMILALVAFTTNVFNGGMFTKSGVASTPIKFVKELKNSPEDPYRKTSNWINENLKTNATAWVLPRHMVFPLLFHSPQLTYAWQVPYPPVAKQYENLPRPFYKGLELPDYIICFGPSIIEVAKFIQKNRLPYAHIQTVDVFWKDLHRPELFWRSFESIKNYNRNVEAVYVLKRVHSGPLPASRPLK